MLGGRVKVDQAQDDLRTFGAPESVIDALGDHAEEADLEVEPENWPTIQLWLRCQTQWIVGFSGRTGLNYSGVDVVMRRIGANDEDGNLFAGLQVMEIAALRAMASIKR